MERDVKILTQMTLRQLEAEFCFARNEMDISFVPSTKLNSNSYCNHDKTGQGDTDGLASRDDRSRD